jgi:glycosyltransferase involved in cell wall biosynthesis
LDDVRQQEPDATRCRSLIITGMHRSGTSLVASVLQRAGLMIGEDLLGVHRGNPWGHFEDRDFLGLHEDGIRARGIGSHGYGTGLHVPDTSLLSGFDADERQRALGLVEQRASIPHWGFKDPRTTLFLESWSQLLPDARFLLVYRHPLDVVLSLLRRAAGTDRKILIDPLIGHETWQVYNARVLDFARRHRDRCFLASIVGIAADLEGFVRRLGAFVEMPLDASDVGTLYHPEELRSSPRSPAVERYLEWADPHGMRLFAELEAMADLPGSEDSLRETTAVDDVLDGLMEAVAERELTAVAQSRLHGLALGLLEPATLSERSLLLKWPEGIERNVRNLEQHLDGLKRHIDNLEALRDEQGARIRELGRHTDNLAARCKEREESIAALSRHMRSLEEVVGLRSGTERVATGAGWEGEAAPTAGSLRICHVIHTFPPYSRAGSENYLEALATMQSREHTVSVFHRVAEPERPEYEVTEGERDGLSITKINRCFSDFSGLEDTYDAPAVAEAFAAHLDGFRPHVVHVHHTTCLSMRIVHEAKARGIPVVYTLHDFWLICARGQLVRRDLSLCNRHRNADCVRCLAAQLPIRGGYERTLELWERAQGLQRWPLPADVHRRLASRPFARETEAMAAIEARNRRVRELYELVDRFIAPSRFLLEEYVRYGVPREKIVYSDYGFDLEAWDGVEDIAQSRPGGPLRVAYLGTWIPSKGLDVLLEAFHGIEPADAVLDVHGYAVPYDGVEDYEARLRTLAAGACNIRLGARYEPTDVPRLLAAADVLAVPSIWYENSPLTIHEAFLAGVPVVASDHGGMRELVRHEVNGLLFRPRSVADLRRQLRRLIEDPALLARLCQGLPRVKSIEENGREIEALYRGLVG